MRNYCFLEAIRKRSENPYDEYAEYTEVEEEYQSLEDGGGYTLIDADKDENKNIDTPPTQRY